MALTSKTRKILWGRSGNCCAICKTELVLEPTAVDDHSVIGEECHINSGRASGPRHDPSLPTDKLDLYDNLILLCGAHHTQIDHQQRTYTVEKLRKIKKDHEHWVAETLNKSPDIGKMVIRRLKANIPQYMVRISEGRALSNILSNTYAYDFDHDELHTEEEVSLVADFLQNAQDWGDLASGLESSEKVGMSYHLSQGLQELELAGFWVFGAREVRILDVNGETSDWPVVILRVLRSTNPLIIDFKLHPNGTEKV